MSDSARRSQKAHAPPGLPSGGPRGDAPPGLPSGGPRGDANRAELTVEVDVDAVQKDRSGEAEDGAVDGAEDGAKQREQAPPSLSMVAHEPQGGDQAREAPDAYALHSSAPDTPAAEGAAAARSPAEVLAEALAESCDCDERRSLVIQGLTSASETVPNELTRRLSRR